MTADVVPRMEAASPALNLPSAAKLRPSPAVPGSMESAIKMWLQVGNVQKLQQVSDHFQGSVLKSAVGFFFRKTNGSSGLHFHQLYYALSGCIGWIWLVAKRPNISVTPRQ